MSNANTYVEALSPNVVIFGGGAFGRQLGLYLAMRVGLSSDGIFVLTREEVLELCAGAEERPYDRKRPSASQEESSHEKPKNLLAP